MISKLRICFLIFVVFFILAFIQFARSFDFLIVFSIGILISLLCFLFWKQPSKHRKLSYKDRREDVLLACGIKPPPELNPPQGLKPVNYKRFKKIEKEADRFMLKLLLVIIAYFLLIILLGIIIFE